MTFVQSRALLLVHGRHVSVSLIDLRHVLDYEAEPRTLPGAIRLPAEELEQRGKELPHGRTLVLYCS